MCAGQAYAADLRGVACFNYLFKRHWKRRKLPNLTRTTELTVSPLFRSKKHLNLAVNTYYPLNYVCVDKLLKTNLTEPKQKLRPKKARLSKLTPELRSHTLRSQEPRLPPGVLTGQRMSASTYPRSSNVYCSKRKRCSVW